MRFTAVLTTLLASTQLASSASIPAHQAQSLSARNENHILGSSSPDALSHVALEKRKGGGGGGGGGGGRGGGGGSSSGGSRGGSSSSSSSGKTGGSSSSSSSYRSSPASNIGGATRSGSGRPRYYGYGQYYGGGSVVPYAAGAVTVLGLVPIFLAASALAFFPGSWPFGAYMYPFKQSFTFANHTAIDPSTNTTTTRNETISVKCLCQLFAECGCENNQDPQFVYDLLGNGSYAALNHSLVVVANVNGTQTLFINGSLPNGTTAPGGSAAPGMLRIQQSGWLIMATTIALAVLF